MIKNSEYLVEQLAKKMHKIKQVLLSKLKNDNIVSANETMEDFTKAFKSQKQEDKSRLRTQYSYDIKD